MSSDSATAGGEAEWQERQGQWQVQYGPAGVNITLRVAVAHESNLVDGYIRFTWFCVVCFCLQVFEVLSGPNLSFRCVSQRG